MNKERLSILLERLKLVHGNLLMNGLLTHHGKAPLSPLGYALKIPAFFQAGLGYKPSFNEEMNVSISALRFPKAGGGSHQGLHAAAAFFECSVPVASDLFTRGAYPAAWEKADRSVPVADIIARLQSYLEEY